MINRMLIGLMIAVACFLFPLFFVLQALGFQFDFVNELAEKSPDPREIQGKPFLSSGKFHVSKV